MYMAQKLSITASRLTSRRRESDSSGNYEAKVYVPSTLQNPGVTEAFSGKNTGREFQTMIYSYDFDAGDQDNSVNKVRLGNKGAAGEWLDLDYIVATIKVGADEYVSLFVCLDLTLQRANQYKEIWRC